LLCRRSERWGETASFYQVYFGVIMFETVVYVLMICFFVAVLAYSIYLITYGTPDPNFSTFKSFLEKYKNDRSLDHKPVLEKLKGTKYHDILMAIIEKN
jgi:hypothetical protein